MPLIGMNGDTEGLSFHIDGVRRARFLYPVPAKPCGLSPGSNISDRFEESKALVDEAIFNLQRFEDSLDTFNEKTKPFELRQQFDASDNCWTYRLVTKERFPKQLEAIAKSVVHNLRAALDLMVAALIRGGGKVVSKRAGFPISKSKAAFEKELGSKLENVPDPVVRFIRRLKPYEGGSQALWALAQLDNLGKHNQLPPVAVAGVAVAVRTAMPGVFVAPDGSICLGGGPPGSTPFGHDHGYLIPEGTSPIRIENDDVELYRMDASIREVVTDVTLNAAFVTIGPASLTRNQPLYEVFTYLIHLVQRILNSVERCT
ncbi:hypothetical protein J2J97_02470 [Rhizobium bangladeshense]|uniref:hypothetical protein n=1 Tax=Rhizobium bangladeshense TaxID=1138189 RepID=UPI001A98274E|nr:hypothetical protein [Rhizobium bangladeshense]QSY94829.1 hypothetical protein J2J97_02470 [Rhizobium bangladeshense]